MKRDRTLGGRLYWACFWVYLLIAGLIALAQLGEVFLRERQELARDLAGYAQSFDRPLAAALWSLDDAEVEAVVNGLLTLPPILGVRVSDPTSGFVLAQSGRPFPAANTATVESGPATGADGTGWPVLDAWDGIVHRRAVWFDHQTGQTQVGVLEISSDIRQVLGRIWLSVLLLLGGAGIKAITLWIIFRSLFRAMLARPLEQLADGMAALDVEHPAEIDRDGTLRAIGGEVRGLVDRFNELVGRLADEIAAHRALHDRLEKQVEARTAALSIARERAEVARREAEAADEAKSRFLAMMSHELRTPMTGVLGMMEIMQTEPMTEAQRENLQIMRASAETLMRILNDILDYSRIEAGYLELQTAAFDLRALVEGVVVLFQNNARTKGLSLRSTIALDVPERVCGDPHRLRQVLMNLVSNGVKFTEHGEVVITVRSLGRSFDTVRLGFEVADTGPGIPPDRQGDLFKPFSQLDRVASRRVGGTGLGLVVSERLVTAMGGTIAYREAPGGGAAFQVVLPLQPVTGTGAQPALLPIPTPDPAPIPASDPVPVWAAEGAEGAEPGRDAGTSLTILLVEDVPVNRAILGRLLGAEGHVVETVSSGVEALEAAATGRFDLVLMDIHMPVMDGVTATRAIRRLPPPAHAVPVVALTADVLGHAFSEADAPLFDGFVAKPVDLRKLREMLATQTDRHPALPSGTAETDDPSDETAVASGERDWLDPTGLARVREGLSEQDAADLFGAFVDTVAAQVRDLRQALHDRDRRALRAAAHTLKGTAANFAAMRLSQQATAIQDAVDRDEAVPPEAVDSLERCLFNTLAAVRTTFSL